MPRRSVEERFAEKVDQRTPSECWPWTAYIGDKGYGQFHDGRRLVKAHRFAYEKAFGPVEDGLVVDHTCHNESDCTDVPCSHRACCNPAHLEATTQSVNSIRGRSGNHQLAKTHCPNGHEYTPENTILRDGGRHRVCRTCNKTHQKNYNTKRKAG